MSSHLSPNLSSAFDWCRVCVCAWAWVYPFILRVFCVQYSYGYVVMLCIMVHHIHLLVPLSLHISLVHLFRYLLYCTVCAQNFNWEIMGVKLLLSSCLLLTLRPFQRKTFLTLSYYIWTRVQMCGGVVGKTGVWLNAFFVKQTDAGFFFCLFFI